MTEDPRAIVRAGYDRLGPRYLEWTLDVDPIHRVTYQRVALDLIAPGSLVVELGCGPGVPTARDVAESCRLVGVDLSRAQLGSAKRKVPAGRFVQADMSAVEFRPAMYWSGFDPDSNLEMIRNAGYDVLRSELLDNFEDGRTVQFHWVLAKKPEC